MKESMFTFCHHVELSADMIVIQLTPRKPIRIMRLQKIYINDISSIAKLNMCIQPNSCKRHQHRNHRTCKFLGKYIASRYQS